MSYSHPPENKKVLFLCCDTDRAIVNKYVRPALEKNGLSFKYVDDLVDSNRQQLQMITNVIKQCCGKFLVFITENFVNSQRCNFSLLLALEKCQKTSSMSVVFLLADGEMPFPSIPLCQKAPQFTLDWNKGEWPNLISELKKQVKTEEILPAGNIAQGFAYSHFGYLKDMLPYLGSKIAEYRFYGNGERMPTRHYMVLPKSCMIPSKLSEIHPEIRFEEKLDAIEITKAGNVCRKITPPVYSIKDDDGTEYRFVGESITILGILHTLQEKETSGCTIDGVQRKILSENDKELERNRFAFTIQTLIESGFEQSTMILEYDDTTMNGRKKLYSDLLTAIKKDLSLPNQPPSAQRQRSETEEVYSRNDSIIYERDVYIINDLDCPQDGAAAREDMQFLKQHKITCCHCSDVREGSLNNMTQSRREEELIRTSKWTVMYISKESLRNNWLSWWRLSILTECVDDNKTKLIIILLDDIEEGNIPEDIRWVTYLYRKQDNYKWRLLQTVDSTEKTVIGRKAFLIPGDVSVGFAWCYFINYLRFQLPALLQNINEKLDTLIKAGSMKESDICPRRLFVIIPENSECSPRLDAEFPGDIQHVEALKPVIRTIGGSIEREYKSNLYRLQDSNQPLYCVVEYATPSLTLHDMFEDNNYTEEETKKQSEKFYNNLSRILESKVKGAGICRERCTLIFFKEPKARLPGRLRHEVMKAWRQHFAS